MLATSLKNPPPTTYYLIEKTKKQIPRHTKARVWQPFPASLASLPNTCFSPTAPAPLKVL